MAIGKIVMELNEMLEKVENSIEIIENRESISDKGMKKLEILDEKRDWIQTAIDALEYLAEMEK